MIKYIALCLLSTGLLQAEMQLAEGFKLDVFAGPPNISSVTSLAVAPDGTVYASRDDNSSIDRRENAGSIVKIEDSDKDGKADKFTVFVDNIDSPRGSCFINDTLYVVHPPFLSSFRDTDGDGVADEHVVLVKKLGFDLSLRGADHTSNGVRMGIDGWLYMAIGDFGIVDGEGTDGSKVTLWGGGVVRCRPDGSELEIFSSNTRNIYDLAISPFMDIFSRDNTNDGKGWDIRLHHFTNLTDMGYPRLYQHFSEDHIQPIADYGGGSGTGGYFLQEPGFPDEYNNKVYTCDFTTGHIYYHPMQRNGTTFSAEQKSFFKPGRAIDMDVDGNSQIFACDWNNGNYRYQSNDVGKIYRITYPGLKAARLPDLSTANALQLVALLESRSAVCRINAQRKLIEDHQVDDKVKTALISLATKKTALLESRVAAIFTLEQLFGQQIQKEFMTMSKDQSIREFAIRALSNRKSQLKGLDSKLFIQHLDDTDARVQLQATITLSKLKAKDATKKLLQLAILPKDSALRKKDGHTRLPLTARRACQIINDRLEILKAVGTDPLGLAALNTLKTMYHPEVVHGLIAKLESSTDDELSSKIITTLYRLYFREGKRKGSHFWGGRPVDDGPHFSPVRWDMTAVMKPALEKGFNKLPKSYHNELLKQMQRHQIEFDEFKLDTELDKVAVLLKKEFLAAKDIQDLTKLFYDEKYRAQQADIFEHMGSIKKAMGQVSLASRFEIAQAVLEGKAVSERLVKAVDNFLHDPNLMNQYYRKFYHLRGQKQLSLAVNTYLLNLMTMPLVHKQTQQRTRNVIVKSLAAPVNTVLIQLIGEMKVSGFEKELNELREKEKYSKVVEATLHQLTQATEKRRGVKMSEYTLKKAQAALKNVKGDKTLGKLLFSRQGCIACHATSQSEVQKGPYMGNVGGAFNREYILESIIDPDKVLSQGFATVTLTLNDGSTRQGFISSKTDDIIELRNLFGQLSIIPRSEVKNEHKAGNSMMPTGLVNTLNIQEFASLLDYLCSLK
jgi:putative membrane-bound dehydrogenase-like protein